MHAGLKAAALIVVPILCGVVFFLVAAPDRGPGVFLETERGMYRLSGHPTDAPHSLVDSRTSAGVSVEGWPISFFVVGYPMPAGGPAATLYAFVVDDADPTFRSERLPIPAAITQINSRGFRVKSSELVQWGADTPAFRQYQEVIRSRPGSRATIEAWMGLEIQPSASGPRDMYAIRIGPR